MPTLPPLAVLLLISQFAPAAAPAGGLAIVPVPDHKVQTPLSPTEEKKHFVLPEGFEIELVAAEPLVINPVTLALRWPGAKLADGSIADY